MRPEESGPTPGEPAPVGRAFGAFQHRDFRFFWGGSVISNVGAWMQQVAQGWLVYELTGSALLVGLNGLFHAVPFILVSLYAGTVVDRVDRRKLLLWVEGFSTSVVVVMGTLVASGHIQLWHIYLASAAVSLAGGFESPTRQALLPHLIPREDLMTAVSLNSIVRKGAQIVGPTLGGLFVAAFGVAGAYFIHGAASGVLMWCIVQMRATNPTKATRQNAIEAIGEGLRYVKGSALISTLLLMEAAMSTFGSYQAMMVIFAKDVFAMGPQGLGLLQSAAGIGSVVGSFTLATVGDVKRKGLLLLWSGIAYGVALIGFAYSPGFFAALAVLPLVGATDIVFGATRTTITQLLVPREMLGRVMSMQGIAMRGLGNFGTFQTGALASVLGVHAAIALGASACILVTVAAGWLVPAVRSFGTAEPRSRAGMPPEAPSAVSSVS